VSRVWPNTTCDVTLIPPLNCELFLATIDRSHLERDLILWAVRLYEAYPISYAQPEEMMEHDVAVDRVLLARRCD
jgi:hypothetical protein